MLLSPISFCHFLRNSLSDPYRKYFFNATDIWKSFLIQAAETNLYVFYYVREYRGFNKIISLMVENSTRVPVFILFLRGLFYHNEEHFLMNQTYYKNCFVRGSGPKVFCK